MRHPFDCCAVRPFCYCCYLDPEVTCYVVSVIAIVVNGFSGATNFGWAHWTVYVASIVNLTLHLGAGIILFMGTLWGKDDFKLAYCWLCLLAVITVICAAVAYFLTYKNKQNILSDVFSQKEFMIFVCIEVVWLLVWDIYSPMVVLGNTGHDDGFYC